MPARASKKKSPARVLTPQRGALHHIRRNVLLLLGFYNVPLHTGIVCYAREADWILDDQYIRVGLPSLGWQGDGILALITNPKDARTLHRFPKVPLVDLSKGWISNTMPAKYRAEGFRHPRVYYDNQAIGRLAAEHFLERGFKHIAYMNCGNYWLDIERIPSFRRTVEAAGSQYYEIPYYKLFPKHSRQPMRDAELAHAWLMQAVRDCPKPVGIAVTADDLAARLLRVCDDAGLVVPEEVAVLGCDNDPMVCDYAPVPLSSVDNNWEQAGYEGAKLLDQLMNGRCAPRKPILIPPKGVVTRLSTNILAVPDLKTARALRFIWENFQNPIGTKEIAAVAGLNRRKLERDFRRHLGRSVKDEITQLRLERAKKLLLETSLKANEVAGQCGFSSIVHFSKVFHQHTKIRPSHYRRRQRLGV